jgi:hypothetical protein
MDVARAHLILEAGLRERPAELGGDAFLVTGDGQPWRFGDVWHTVQVRPASVLLSAASLNCRSQLFTPRDLHFFLVPAVLMFAITHMVEAIVLGQFYLLRLIGVRSSLTPEWLGPAVMASRLHRVWAKLIPSAAPAGPLRQRRVRLFLAGRPALSQSTQPRCCRR